VNAKPSWNKTRRSAVRTQVYELERRVAGGDGGADLRKFADRTSNLVGQLGRFHKREANSLRTRVRIAREAMNATPQICTTISTALSIPQPLDVVSVPPWGNLEER